MMNYTIKNHPTRYNGVLFRSRLEARWAAFFDLIGWQWEYEPIDLNGWTPDFRVHWKCGHSQCPNGHVLFVEVKPYFTLDEFHGHPCTKYYYGVGIPASSSACFGINPYVTHWEMVHGNGGGEDSIPQWDRVLGDIDTFWKLAGERVQWHPGGDK